MFAGIFSDREPWLLLVPVIPTVHSRRSRWDHGEFTDEFECPSESGSGRRGPLHPFAEPFDPGLSRPPGLDLVARLSLRTDEESGL
jgi:hypothetical protein